MAGKDKGFGRQLESIINAIKDPVIIIGLKNKTSIGNSAAPLLQESVLNCHLSDDCVRHESDACPHCCFLSDGDIMKGCIIRQSLDQNQAVSGIFKLRFKDDTYTYAEISSTPCPDNLVIHAKFIADPFTAGNDSGVVNLTHVDTLTGLPNIFFIKDTLDHEMIRTKRNSKKLAVMFIDMQRFKKVNSFLGRDGGDKVLKHVASRIRSTLRHSDIVARQGGDVFIAVVTDINLLQDIITVAKKIIKVISHPITIGSEEVRTGARIGISIFPEDGPDATVLLKNADTALQNAKHKGNNTFYLYKKEMDSEAGEMLLIENKMYNAIDNDEFILYYQPQMETTTGKITGAEALIRWNSPVLGMISPLKFIPLAEELGIIINIGKWVIDTACRQAKEWADQNFPHICVSVNVSMKQFRDPELIGFIKATLKKYNLPPHCLGIEVTENVIMENPERVIKTMAQVSELGMEMSIDDFGTGYSSLGYLKNLPVGKLKIDKTFISNITKDEADAAIVKTVVNLAHNFNLKVCAEGVETPEQVAFLSTLGCDELQGYFLSKPLPAEDFRKLWYGMLLCN